MRSPDCNSTCIGVFVVVVVRFLFGLLSEGLQSTRCLFPS